MDGDGLPLIGTGIDYDTVSGRQISIDYSQVASDCIFIKNGFM